jgi:hypothetical protein
MLIFTVPIGGPLTTIIEPEDGTYSSCDDQAIHVLINDPDGIDTTTIRISVDGREYTLSAPELSFYSPDSLVFTPSSRFTDGHIVVVSLISASRYARKPAFCRTGYMELYNRPFFTGFMDISPVPDIWMTDPCPVISFNIEDSLAGFIFLHLLLT